MLRPACWLLLVMLGAVHLAAQPLESTALGDVLRAALIPALPFPEALSDGTPVGGVTAPVWTVRWPAAGEPRVEVLANPLNPGNRERALKAEAEIQKAAMAAQRRSQADYEQAVSDFQRIGRIGEIRQVSLNDEGIAGERYDAESQLTIRAEPFDGSHVVQIATSRRPEVVPGGAAAVVRVAANTYQGAGTADEPGIVRFCPEQAWVYFGVPSAPTIEAGDDVSATVSVTSVPGSSAVVVSISGNAELVDQVLQQADWEAFRARVAG